MEKKEEKMPSFTFLSGVLFGGFSASASSFDNGYGGIAWEDTWTLEKISDFENVDHKAAFDGWKVKFGKTYTDISEESHRFLVFLDNWKKINDHNLDGNSNYTMRLNQFGDLTSDEFRYQVHGHTGSCIQKRKDSNKKRKWKKEKNVKVPSSIDWTDYNGTSYVTPVKNQGDCGSCWAFSTTGSIESRYAIAKGELNSLSEQQLVDCSGSYGNAGCDGGLMDNAFRYVIATGGLCSESEYAYTGEDGTCQSASCGTYYDAISNYADVTSDSEPSLEAAVAQGPVSIAIEADQYAFQVKSWMKVFCFLFSLFSFVFSVSFLFFFSFVFFCARIMVFFCFLFFLFVYL